MGGEGEGENCDLCLFLAMALQQKKRGKKYKEFMLLMTTVDCCFLLVMKVEKHFIK